MKTKLILITLLILSTFSLQAQVKLFEWELVSAGPVFGVQKSGNNQDIQNALEYLTEFRVNLMDGKFSPGLQAQVSGWDRVTTIPNRSNDLDKQYSYAIQAVGDYNFFPTKNVCPFAGLGIGTSLNVSGDFNNRHSYSFIATPRVGVELFKWVRFTFEYHAQQSPYSNFAARAGIVIGGWNKKKAHQQQIMK